MRGRSQLVKSLVWFFPFLCVKREERRQEKNEREEMKKCFLNVSKPKKKPDELLHNDSKKKPSDESFVRKFRI